MLRKWKRALSVLAAGSMLLTFLPQGPSFAEAQSILSENYTDGSISTAELAGMGWTAEENLSWVNPGSTTFAVEQDGLRIRKGWSNLEGSWQCAYQAERKLEQSVESYNGDPRVTVRRSHFKGVYDLKLTSSCSLSNRGIYENFQLVQADGTANTFYLEQYADGNLKIAGQNVTLATDMTGEQSYRLRFDFTESGNGFQLFRGDSAAPVSVDGRDKFPMSTTSDALNPLPSYLTGLYYHFQARDATGAEILIKNMELSEIERTADVTDAALAQLGMSALTDTPEAVTGALKELPAALAGAEITWTSSDTDVISNDGQSVNRPTDADCDVVLTAEIVNPADGFTQRAEYRLTVPKASGDEFVVAAAREALTPSVLSREPADRITQNLIRPLPSTDSTGTVSITWESSDKSVITDEGVVIRPDSFSAATATMTARFTLNDVTAEKSFDFKVLGTRQERVILDENYRSGIQNEELGALGWSVLQSPENGSYGITGSGLRIIKTLPQGNGFQAAYRVQRDLRETIPNYRGDRHMTLRREQFKGIYDLELGMAFTNSRGAIMFFLSGGRGDGSVHDFYLSQQGTGGANTLTFDNSYNYGQIAAGLNQRHSYKFRLDYENDITVGRSETKGFQLFFDGSGEPQADAGMKSTVFPMENQTISSAKPAYLDSINFWLQTQNSTNANVVIDSLKLMELSRTEDVTDEALAQLGMESVTDTPDDVSGALKELPSALAGAEITWSSSHPEIISNDGQTVTKPPVGDKVVTMTAAVQNPEDKYTQYLDFALTVKAQNQVEYDGETIVEESYSQSMTADELSALGWTADSSGGGTLTADADGLKLVKTAAQGSGTDAAYGAAKKLWQTVVGFGGDERMTVRRNHYKGIYDLEIDMAVSNTNGQSSFSVNGIDAGGAKKELAALRQSADNTVSVFPLRGTVVSGADEQHTYKARLDLTNDVTFLNGTPTGATKAFQLFMDVKGSREEVVADFRFNGEEGRKLIEMGVVRAGDGSGLSVNEAGNLVVKKTQAGDGSEAYVPAVQFITRGYDEAEPFANGSGLRTGTISSRANIMLTLS